MNRFKRLIMVTAIALFAIIGTGVASASAATVFDGESIQRPGIETWVLPDTTDDDVCANHPYPMWCFELCRFNADSDYCNLTVEGEDNCANHPYPMWCYELCPPGADSDYCNLTVKEFPLFDWGGMVNSYTGCTYDSWWGYDCYPDYGYGYGDTCYYDSWWGYDCYSDCSYNWLWDEYECYDPWYGHTDCEYDWWYGDYVCYDDPYFW